MSTGSAAPDFAILPAIDLRGGQVVRLRGGDFDQETAYGDDPAAVAAAFSADGATWLHVVDLDGARDGASRQTVALRSICDRVGDRAVVEAAGGLRTEAAVAAVLEAGAGRAVLGTAALRDPAFAGRLVRVFGAERIVVALDVRDGLAVGEAWRPGAPGGPAETTLARLAEAGVALFEVTGIARDGSLAGPDLELLRTLLALGRGAVIASGGIASLADLRAVRAIGCAGAIVGRAIYEGRIDLRAALQLETGRERASGRSSGQ